MLGAARAAGVTSIVCTPHCREPHFDYGRMWDAFELLRAHAGGFPLAMGFEVNHDALMNLGMGWADHLAFDGDPTMLLEFSPCADEMEFRRYEQTIYQLQGRGFTVIIAHPERCRAVQRDIRVAERLVRLGCSLQASANFVAAGRLSRQRRSAKLLFERGLYSHVASDAHRPGDYAMLRKALAQAYVRGVGNR